MSNQSQYIQKIITAGVLLLAVILAVGQGATALASVKTLKRSSVTVKAKPVVRRKVPHSVKSKSKKVVAPAIVTSHLPAVNHPEQSAPNQPLVYIKTVTNNDPIILTGDQVMEIKDVHYIENNNIILKDRAQLIIHNALFEQRAASSTYTLEAKDAATVTITDAQLGFSAGTNWDFTDTSKLNLTNVTGLDGTNEAWHELSGSAQVTVKKSKFFGSIADRADLSIDQSPDIILNLNLNGSITDESLPRKITSFSFPNYNDRNIYYKVNITNSVVSEWGIMASVGMSNVTIRDADSLNVGFSIGWPLQGNSLILENLVPGHIDDRLISINYNNLRLHLINTTVHAWQPLVGQDNQVTFRNSELTEQRWNMDTAKVIYENCILSLVRAKDNVEMTIRNSTVNGDVTAVDNGKINLFNTKVMGQKITSGNGQIIGSL